MATGLYLVSAAVSNDAVKHERLSGINAWNFFLLPANFAPRGSHSGRAHDSVLLPIRASEGRRNQP